MTHLTTSKIIAVTAASVLAFGLSTAAHAKIATGATVGDMSVTDSNGTVHNLSDFAGKNIVLEWTNHGCPYVKKHYNAEYNNMQTLQAEATANGAVWLSVISSAPGKQGHVTGNEANVLTEKRGASPSAVILDPEGTTGRTFSAKTTPHMYVINTEGVLVYQGAIDSDRSARPSAIPDATNYVREALNAIESGESLATTETAPYGCSVKYSS